MRPYISLVLFLLLSTSAFAGGKLSPSEIERVKAFKQLIVDVDKKSVEQTIRQIEKGDDPHFVLQIQEIIAKVYSDIIRDNEVKDTGKREWIYGLVALNMANLQFGGTAGRDSMNAMIRKRLQDNLPHSVLSHPDFHVSTEKF
jgi:hypothetical protein